MASTSVALSVTLALLMVDSVIELAFISSMVAWLHHRAGQDFEVALGSSTFLLHGKPESLLVNQGHTSNGAAGTAFVLIGLGGIFALWMRRRSNLHANRISTIFYHFWVGMTLLSTLLTFTALIYTFTVTADHSGQPIDVHLASSLVNQAYPVEAWTPENWFTAVLRLDLVSQSERSDIQQHLNVMKAWRWNLIPLFILGLAVCGLAVAGALSERRNARDGKRSEYAAVTQKSES